MNILFIGDICGRPGRSAVKKILPELQKELSLDMVIANIENASSKRGVSQNSYNDLKDLKIDCFTSGNHIWANKEIFPVLEDSKEKIIRPANLPEGTIGRGVWTGQIGSQKIAVINLIGRVFMPEGSDDPFRTIDHILESLSDHLVMVDFHAEATSEKRALGFYLDGRVNLVAGTHTHVPTADQQLLPGGTAYITDVGFVGPRQSVLGIKKEIIIHNFLYLPHQSHDVASGPVDFNAILIKTGGQKTTEITPVHRTVD